MAVRHSGPSDAVRVFYKALDLLCSSTPESEQELLEMVKKAKKEYDKDATFSHPPKRQRTARPSGDAGAPSSKPESPAGQPEQVVQAPPPQPTKSTARVTSGVARGRVEKPKRKTAR